MGEDGFVCLLVGCCCCCLGWGGIDTDINVNIILVGRKMKRQNWPEENAGIFYSRMQETQRNLRNEIVPEMKRLENKPTNLLA